MALSHLSYSYAQNPSDATMQEHDKFVKQGLAKGPSFKTREEQVPWNHPKYHVIGVHIHVVISPEFF